MIAARILASLATVAVAGSLLSGCGAEEAAGVDVAKAAEATRSKGTARMTMTMRMSGLGLGDEITVESEGVTSLRGAQADFTMDFGELLSAAGAEGDGSVRIRFDGADVYVDPPDIEGLNLPGGGGWIGLDARRLVEALGIDADAASALFTVDPASQLRALRAAGSLEEVGSEDVDGTETTHYKGAYSAEDVVETLPAGRREEIRKALDELAELSGDDDAFSAAIPVELWVDEAAVVHRMRTATTIPGRGGAPAGRIDMTYELSDFGAELDVSRPDGVTDVTDTILRALRGQGLSAG